MKKILSIICMLAIALILLNSCASDLPQASESNGTSETSETKKEEAKNDYSVLVYDFSDSIEFAKHEVEYEFADHARYDGNAVNSEIDITINGKQHHGILRMTLYSGYNYYPVHRYLDSDGVTFEIDENNKLVSCFWGASDKDDELPKDDCVTIAVDFMKDKIDLSKYTVSVTEDETNKRYKVEFKKYIGNFETTDSASVVVLYSGELYSYSSHMLGRVFADNAINDTNPDSVIASVYAKLNIIYSDAKTYCSEIKYEEPSLELTTLKDGKSAFICSVVVNCIQSYEEFDAVISERINFVVMSGN